MIFVYNSKHKKYLWNVGLLAYQSGQTLITDVNQEALYKWRGNIGLINATDYVKASTNTECTVVVIKIVDFHVKITIIYLKMIIIGLWHHNHIHLHRLFGQ